MIYHILNYLNYYDFFKVLKTNQLYNYLINQIIIYSNYINHIILIILHFINDIFKNLI